jgi:hypothetical protein
MAVNATASGGAAWSYFSSCASVGRLTPLTGFRYSDNHSRYAGDVSGWKYFGYNDLYNCYQGTNYLTLSKSDGYKEAYWSMWLRSETNGQDEKVRNVKIANWNNDAASYPQGRWDFYPSQGPDSGHVYALSCGSSSSNKWGVGARSFGYGSKEWNRFEGYLDAGDPGVENGLYEISRNGTLLRSTGRVMIRNSESCRMPDTFYFTHYHDDIDTAYPDPKPEQNLYHGEIYFDITRARVELCDSPEWSSRTHCEIQLPHTRWVDSVLQLTIRKGSFAEGQPTYLFVVDANGTASKGHPIASDLVFHAADTDRDRCISMQELTAHMTRWIRDEITLQDIMEGIRIWKDGCPYLC